MIDASTPQEGGDGQRNQQNVDQRDQDEVLHRVAPDAETGHPEGIVTLNHRLWQVLMTSDLLFPLWDEFRRPRLWLGPGQAAG